jgi:ATP-dependent exoDNAse (exonuclease V) beta subunit
MTWREAEARALALRLRELVDDGTMTPGDIVVLVRTATTMRPYVDALRGVGFEVFAGDAGGFYAAPEVADIRALLRVLANPLDGEGVVGLLAGGLGGLTDDALCLLAASRDDTDLWTALSSPAAAGLSPPDAERATLVRTTIALLRERQGRRRLADTILHAVSVLGPGGGCLARAGARANLRKVARLAAEFEQVTPADPAAFLRHLADRESYVRKESPISSAVEGAGSVRVMTIHGAKGLEFPVVVVADLGHGQPNRPDPFMVTRGERPLVAVGRLAKAVAPERAPDASAWRRAVDDEERLDAEESKRVFYVACTRAEQALVLTGSTDLSKAPVGGSAVDRLRAAIADAGPAGVPGLAVTEVTAGDEDRLAPAGDARLAASGSRRECGMPDPLAVLRAPDPIAPPVETSYTALALYERCGYRFFAERMLGVGSVDVVGGDDPRAIGSALHGALQTLAEGRAVDKARLRALASAHGLEGEGVLRLKSAIEAFVASPAGGLLTPGDAEVPFAVRVGGGTVTGSMDLVVREGGKATVVDYKTGVSKASGEPRYRAQAEIYALALLVAGCTAVTVRFVRVEAGCEETAFAFRGADRARIAARVEEAFASMARGEFGRLSAFDSAICPDCPVSGGLCPIVHPGRKATHEN